MNLPRSFSRRSIDFSNSTINPGILLLAPWQPERNPDAGEGSIDWQWLAGQPAVEEQGCVLRLQFSRPLRAILNSRSSQGVIFKPATAE
jgi:hypothetical protein